MGRPYPVSQQSSRPPTAHAGRAPCVLQLLAQAEHLTTPHPMSSRAGCPHEQSRALRGLSAAVELRVDHRAALQPGRAAGSSWRIHGAPQAGSWQTGVGPAPGPISPRRPFAAAAPCACPAAALWRCLPQTKKSPCVRENKLDAVLRNKRGRSRIVVDLFGRIGTNCLKKKKHCRKKSGSLQYFVHSSQERDANVHIRCIRFPNCKIEFVGTVRKPATMVLAVAISTLVVGTEYGRYDDHPFRPPLVPSC
jgi:hypothetical protein